MTNEPKYGAHGTPEQAARLRKLMDEAVEGDARPEPVDVEIVRPEPDYAEIAVDFVFMKPAIALFRGALIMVGAHWVSFVPNWGYWESVAIGLLAGFIFHRPDVSYRLLARRRGAKS